MQILNLILCIILVFMPVIGFLFISEKKISKKVYIPILAFLGLIFVLLLVGIFAADFHVTAFVFQIVLPILSIYAVVGLIICGTAFLAKKGFFNGKRLILTLSAVICLIAVIVCAVFYRQNRQNGQKVDYSKYPDIEITGTWLANNDKKSVTARWESSTNTFTNTSEKEFKYEPDEPYKMPDTVSGEDADVLELFYNADKTAVYYSNDNRIFKYIPADNSYLLIGEAPTDNPGHFLILKICVSEDEKKAFFIACETYNEDVANNLYCLDIETGECSVILQEKRWIDDFEISPDGESIIYNGNDKIVRYDLASGKTETLLEGTRADTRDNGGAYIIRISKDGRYIMYYKDMVPVGCSQVFVYDIETGISEKIIQTNKYAIKDVNWAEN
ncbi:hypothetical protein [Butyrivibrio sp. INlla16]|uniref:hypothetical protein n=1 Tax=Butyrivibrio sp. INlla16 TaxID=1520807 RepID=UPI0008859C8B|nr:hypothetical protein [Butyrivibrio sp. INlla16]SDB69373.1 hypothetical protein SAMN02910263_04433 [Butyrivibrio sp. INlla16]